MTLGARETDDLEVAVNHLRNEGKTSTIALWGRSMGAVTAMMYSRRDPSIAGMVSNEVLGSAGETQSARDAGRWLQGWTR